MTLRQHYRDVMAAGYDRVCEVETFDALCAPFDLDKPVNLKIQPRSLALDFNPLAWKILAYEIRCRKLNCDFDVQKNLDVLSSLVGPTRKYDRLDVEYKLLPHIPDEEKTLEVIYDDLQSLLDQGELVAPVFEYSLWSGKYDDTVLKPHVDGSPKHPIRGRTKGRVSCSYNDNGSITQFFRNDEVRFIQSDYSQEYETDGDPFHATPGDFCHHVAQSGEIPQTVHRAMPVIPGNPPRLRVWADFPHFHM